MNLTDLQQELRSIESRIEMLHNEIEQMKPKPEDEKRNNFEKITKLAGKAPIVRTSISEAPLDVKKTIFSSLSYLLLLEETDISDRLLYLCRLSKGCGYDASAEELYKNGLEFEEADLTRMKTELAEYQFSYLMEAFLIANISGKASKKLLSVIADLANAFGIEKEEIQVIGLVAKSVLTNHFDFMLKLPVPNKKRWSGKFRDYIPEEWIIGQRKLCGTVCVKKYSEVQETRGAIASVFSVRVKENNKPEKINESEERPCEIKNHLPDGVVVRKGDVLCTYTHTKKVNLDKIAEAPAYWTKHFSNQNYTSVERIASPCNGIVHFIKYEKKDEDKKEVEEYIAIYVVSYFDEATELCNWFNTVQNLTGTINSIAAEAEK